MVVFCEGFGSLFLAYTEINSLVQKCMKTFIINIAEKLINYIGKVLLMIEAEIWKKHWLMERNTRFGQINSEKKNLTDFELASS